MTLRNYWPSKVHISECIRTEAEELAESTLLAVHEPMQLFRKGNDEGYFSENDLLDHFLKVERPIPIIGRSGVGKSHLIRWLNAQLKLRDEAKDWHIVRIPKNASLRQVLELLLEGLDGDEFDQARAQIKTVGQQLNTIDVAELLLVFMGQQLRKKYVETEEVLKKYRDSGTKPDSDEYQNYKDIILHANNDYGLPTLINDPNFRPNLLKPTHSIFQFASRLTQGASDDELSSNDYQIHANDLNFSYNLADLSLNARQYVQRAQLNTSESARETAAKVLNEVLGEATRTAFQQLFQFNGGGFQDLFKDIRRFLKDRTLVVLVEDMAAISAIEDVLIDSLLEEGVRDGAQKLCPLRSAIAVTDGYPGYIRRQGTIRTRARYEWWIHENVGNEESTLSRIVDFCSRYINAARYGSKELSKLWSTRDDNNWPPVWHDDNVDKQFLDAFGNADTGIPLYPYNKSAIRALSEKYCKDAVGNLQFNPREVLNQILLSILRDCRDDFESNRFPPVDLAGIKVPGTLRSNIHTLGLLEPMRAETLAGIWGFGAKTFEDLRGRLSADVALSFNFDDLAKQLQSGVVIKTIPEVLVSSPVGNSPKSLAVLDPDLLALEKIESVVDLWFERKQELGQVDARSLRNKLEEMYQIYSRKEWVALGELPTLKSGQRVNIYLPNAMGNPVAIEISFCSDKDFSNANKNIQLQSVALAIFRYAYFNDKDPTIGWSYNQGFDDYTHYQNFASIWVPNVLRVLTEQVREKLHERIGAQLQSAYALGIFRESDTHYDRINKLLLKRENLTAQLPKPLSQTLNELWVQSYDKWDDLRNEWLSLVSSNDHGLQGDIVIPALRQALKDEPNRTLVKTRDLIIQELSPTLKHVQLLSDCNSADEFNSAMQELISSIRKLQKNGNYPTLESLVTSKTLIDKIQKFLDSSQWMHVKNLMSLNESYELIRQFQLANQIDGNVISTLNSILENWKIIFDNAFPKLQNQNAMWGADQLTLSRQRVSDLILDLNAKITKLAGGVM